jgi:hypothetical protein
MTTTFSGIVRSSVLILFTLVAMAAGYAFGTTTVVDLHRDRFLCSAGQRCTSLWIAGGIIFAVLTGVWWYVSRAMTPSNASNDYGHWPAFLAASAAAWAGFFWPIVLQAGSPLWWALGPTAFTLLSLVCLGWFHRITRCY